jgi:maltooligosyltrehalose trehalohydrolase
MLAVYRRLAALRRALPDLTDPRLTRVRCDVDEERGLFVMRRGRVVVAVNTGTSEVTVPDVSGEVLFETPSGVRLADGVLTLPGHGGALLL